jgi:uncharacterized membrane protein YfcA
MLRYTILFLAGVLGAALNAVVGGGSFVTFPALLAAGVPPIQANASSTFVLWPAVVSSTAAYWKALTVGRRFLFAMAVASIAGGALGALLLLRTPPSNFVRLVPWLMLAATLIFTFGGRIVSARPGEGAGPSARAAAVAVALQVAIAVYGGFFGGGMGIVMLASWSLLGMKDLHGSNALRLLLATLINGTAILLFLANRSIAWGPSLVMVVGSVIGGYGAAAWARRLSQVWLRRIVVAIAWAMTGYFFLTITLG